MADPLRPPGKGPPARRFRALFGLAWLGVFLAIADQVSSQGGLTRLDYAAYQWIRDRATFAGYGFWGVVSQLGDGSALVWIGIGMALLLALRRRFLLLAGWAVALLGGGALDYLLKQAFPRPRPSLASDLLTNPSSSFPSGHAMASLIAYGMLAYLISIEFTTSRLVRRGIVAGCAAMVLAVGFSRLYLGVHYLSDVLGGFSAGGLWLTACMAGLEIARPRGAGAPSGPPP